MIRHKFRNRLFSWPNKCAACGEKATDEIESKCSAVTKVGYFVLFATTTRQVTGIRYPVCHKHKMLGSIAGKLSQRNLFNLGMGVMGCIFLYGIGVALFQLINEGKVLVGNDFLFFEALYSSCLFWLVLLGQEKYASENK